MILSNAHPHPAPNQPESLTFADAERRAIVAALEAAHWRVSGKAGAADRLGLKPTTLRAKMNKLGVNRPTQADGTH
jgi:transcriptional regulator with GAF, ATPase, and Fis domain